MNRYLQRFGQNKARRNAVREISRNYFCIILNSNLCRYVKKWHYKHKQVGSTSILTPDQMIWLNTFDVFCCAWWRHESSLQFQFQPHYSHILIFWTVVVAAAAAVVVVVVDGCDADDHLIQSTYSFLACKGKKNNRYYVDKCCKIIQQYTSNFFMYQWQIVQTTFFWKTNR